MEFARFEPFQVRAFRTNQSAMHSTAKFALPDLPLDLEIGCGVGLHPLRYAVSQPHRHLIAIEKTSEKFAKFSRRLEAHPHIGNVTAVQADAAQWVSCNLPSQCVERVFLLYPNPNPKGRSANHRWHQMPFFSKLIDVMKPGGCLTLATNIGGYADEAQEFMVGVWGMNLKERAEIRGDGTFAPRTHFEKKYLSRGEVCVNLILQKP